MNGKKQNKADCSAVQPQHKEIVDVVSKLNKSNYEVLIAVAKTLLSLQTKNK
jgi:hypothetical protein